MAQGSGGFQVETPVMQNAFSQVVEISGEIQAQLNQIESILEALSGGWNGSAFNQFNALSSQILADQAKIRQFIGWIGTTGVGDAKNYMSTEAANVQSTSSLNLG